MPPKRRPPAPGTQGLQQAAGSNDAGPSQGTRPRPGSVQASPVPPSNKARLDAPQGSLQPASLELAMNAATQDVVVVQETAPDGES